MNKFNLVKNYIIHFFRAGNEHSLHSPFLFDLYVKIKKQKDFNYSDIETLRKDLLKNNQQIEVTDFGAGSIVNSTRKRKISEITKNSVSPKFQCEFLSKLLYNIQPKSILELGTSLGVSTAYFSKTISNSQITSIEGCSNIGKLAQTNFSKLKLENINLNIGEIGEILPNILKKKRVDAVFFDGNHTENATIKYFNICLEYTHNNSIFIFDDIYWSKGMQRAWNKIVKNNKSILTLDFFYFGIVFFRNNQPKQHFSLKM